MPHFTQKDLKNDNSPPTQVKIVVVGAGMSGLYSTWRLLNETEGNDDIVILERSGRTGGRLDSDLIEFADGDVVKEEEGGMRFLFDGMDDLMALFLELNLSEQIVPFPMNSGGNNRLFFRGHAFSVNEAKENDFAIWDSLYNLDPAESHVNPKDIINVVFNRILQANPKFMAEHDPQEPRGPKFWQDFRLDCQWNDVSLNNWSLWDLFSEMGYSSECITLLYRLLGFNGTFLSKMNAGVAYQLLEDFPAGVKFRTFKDGFSTLPNKLVESIGSQRIFLNTALESIDPLDSGPGYSLRYSHTDEAGKTTTGIIEAENVILGLPRLALEKLFVRSNAFNALPVEKSRKLWDTLQTASNQPLLKINLYYDQAWWGMGFSGQPSVEFGPNFSDLPTGSVYPFYAISEEVVAGLEYSERVANPAPKIQEKLDNISNSKYRKTAALTIYCDYLNINFWSGLQSNGPLFNSALQDIYNAKQPQTIFPASKAIVREATKFFKQIFNTHYVPEPVLTSARIWEGNVDFDIKPSQQFGYGVHQWAIGADDRQVIKDLVQPLDNLFTCGEAYSDYQGWVEGALRSTDRVLQEGFGLEALSKVYFEKSGLKPAAAITSAYDESAVRLIREYIDPHYEETDGDRHELFVDHDSCIGVNLSYMGWSKD